MAQDMSKEAREMTEDPIVKTQPEKEDVGPKWVTKNVKFRKNSKFLK